MLAVRDDECAEEGVCGVTGNRRKPVKAFSFDVIDSYLTAVKPGVFRKMIRERDKMGCEPNDRILICSSPYGSQFVDNDTGITIEVKWLIRDEDTGTNEQSSIEESCVTIDT